MSAPRPPLSWLIDPDPEGPVRRGFTAAVAGLFLLVAALLALAGLLLGAR